MLRCIYVMGEMDQNKTISLLIRQLKDIQLLADKIVGGGASNAGIEAFSRYSDELVRYIKEKIEAPEIVQFTLNIPVVNYERTEIKLWQFLLLPIWWLILYKDYQARNRAIQEIRSSRGKFATLELMLQNLKQN